MDNTQTRSGFVALIGPPNAGKSTLMNQMVGQKVSIVTPKVQTTRSRIRGIAMKGTSQMVFVDTPGIFTPKRRLDRAMVHAAWQGADDGDVLLLLHDCARKVIDDDTLAILAKIKEQKLTVSLILNKTDLATPEKLLTRTKALSDEYDFEKKSLAMMKSKIGLLVADDHDVELIQNLEENLELVETDMTIFFRKLSDFTNKKEGFQFIKEAFYSPSEISKEVKNKWNLWFDKYSDRLNKEGISSKKRKANMDAKNPKYILRNYMSQMAIEEAEKGNYSLIEELYQLIKRPYDEQSGQEKWFAKRPEWARNKVGCSMLSCSS